MWQPQTDTLKRHSTNMANMLLPLPSKVKMPVPSPCSLDPKPKPSRPGKRLVLRPSYQTVAAVAVAVVDAAAAVAVAGVVAASAM